MSLSQRFFAILLGMAMVPLSLAAVWQIYDLFATWKDPALRLAKPEAPQPQGCVSAQGFSLHADTR